jgi:hypothetical protein
MQGAAALDADVGAAEGSAGGFLWEHFLELDIAMAD